MEDHFFNQTERGEQTQWGVGVRLVFSSKVATSYIETTTESSRIVVATTTKTPVTKKNPRTQSQEKSPAFNITW